MNHYFYSVIEVRGNQAIITNGVQRGRTFIPPKGKEQILFRKISAQQHHIIKNAIKEDQCQKK